MAHSFPLSSPFSSQQFVAETGNDAETGHVAGAHDAGAHVAETHVAETHVAETYDVGAHVAETHDAGAHVAGAHDAEARDAITKSVPISKRKREEEDEYVPDGFRATKRNHPGLSGPVDSRPEPCGEPLVWAEKRQALCDALGYFKSHQGGIYTKEKKPYGMFVDKEAEIRDCFFSQVIIATVGGGRVRDSKTNKMGRRVDQAPGSYAPDAMATHRNRAIVMIGGALHPLFPVKPPHYYNVLAHFQITDVWYDKVMGINGEPVSRVVARFEKIDLNNRSWWTPAGSSGPDAGEFSVGEYACESKTCPTCHRPSKEIYKQGWACLNNGLWDDVEKDYPNPCPKFFEFSSPQNVNELEYNDSFLRERTRYDDSKPLDHDIVPRLPSNHDNDLGCESAFKRGIVCPQCGCCSRRIRWEGWFCENPGCDFEYTVPMRQIPIGSIANDDMLLVKQRKNSASALKDVKHESIRVFESQEEGKPAITTWFLPDEKQGAEQSFIGSVTRIQATPEAHDRNGGYHDLYRALQGQDIRLARSGAKSAGGKNEELTNHFITNFGAPYKYGVVVDNTVGFQDAPKPVMETLLRLTWAGKAAVDTTHNWIEDGNLTVKEDAIPRDFEAYNEQLILGYFQDSKIGAHDDGEETLGPNVASLSLGSPSVMTFRPKKNKRIGDTSKISEKNRAPMLRFVLKHGDMLVMHGAIIQKLYNHQVESKGKHRFALTCRHVIPETIPNAEQRALAFVNGRIPDEWAKIQYDGEQDQFESRITGEVVALPPDAVESIKDGTKKPGDLSLKDLLVVEKWANKLFRECVAAQLAQSNPHYEDTASEPRFELISRIIEDRESLAQLPPQDLSHIKEWAGVVCCECSVLQQLLTT